MAFNRHRYRGGRLPFFLIFALARVFIAGALVMLLWNAVLPDVINLRPLLYWQAVALWILCRLLFGNFGWQRGGKPSAPWRGQWRDKWMKMTPKERETFQQEWKNRCSKKE